MLQIMKLYNTVQRLVGFVNASREESEGGGILASMESEVCLPGS